jgi:hypothetical protein
LRKVAFYILQSLYKAALYSYGDSTGFAPDFPFHSFPRVIGIRNQIFANVSTEELLRGRVFNIVID